ncbi:MAG: 3-phosphoshikimate 1-carboxyvinyltransferase [Planctomycetota bacterium]|nr:MAG: 3-phosphoshikimate 1-carboxyvinyltransferase [Planctomycetota bacterium]
MHDCNRVILRSPHRPIDRVVHPPGSKSLTNRALLAAALGHGRSEVSGILLADDTRHMLNCIEALGVRCLPDESRRKVRIEGGSGYFPNGEAELYCGNAGTVIRFLTAACAASIGDFLLDGDARMRERPIGDLVDGLRDLGAQIGYGMAEGYCPLRVQGRGLRGGRVILDRPVSSQFVSAMLMAAPLAADDVMIDVSRGLPSAPYVAMTLAVMDAFGVASIADTAGRYIVPAPQAYRAARYAVEPDASAASYFFAAAAITGGRVTVEGLGSRSVQGDMGFVGVLERMGCRVASEPDRTTVTGPPEGRLRGVDVDLNAMPDVAQTLAVLAAFSDGPTTIRNVANLRVKETDRLCALATELGRMGVSTEVTGDGISIRPGGPPRAAAIETYGDHRMAMSFALAGLRLDGVEIINPACVNKTFPGFFEEWARF